MDDPRLTPARSDLAAKYLEGKVKAERFVEGEKFEVVEAIALRAAEIVLERSVAQSRATSSPYLTVREAAEYLRAKPQRIYDLLSSRRLTRYKDGSRVLVSRAELDANLAGDAGGHRPITLRSGRR